MSKQQIAKKNDNTIALMTAAGNPIIPTTLSLDYLAGDAGRGSSNVTQKDTATPMATILQANSPQCKKSDGKFIDGAEEGSIYNNVTNEVVNGDEGLVVVPAYFEKIYIEWKPNRGGFVAIHDVNTSLKDKVVMKANAEGKEVPTLPTGNLLIETNQHYVLRLLPDGSFEPMVIPMVSTALKASRTWNSLIKKVTLTDSKGNMFNPASYYKVYKLTTKARQKDQYSWYTWAVEPVGAVPNRTLYEAAKAFETAISSGSVQVKHDIEPGEAEAGKDEDTDKM